jgi:hypothetical protein
MIGQIKTSASATAFNSTSGRFVQRFMTTAARVAVVCGGLMVVTPAFAGPATHFQVTAPASTVAGAPFSLTVTALDAGNAVDTTYAGTVTFTSTDGRAVKPANSTLPGGSKVFTGVKLATAGVQTITAKDTVTPAITGTSDGTLVTAGAATKLIFRGRTTGITGSESPLQITAADAFGNPDTTFAGILHITSTDAHTGTDSTFTAFYPIDVSLTNGVVNLTPAFETPGSQVISASGPLSGSAAPVAISVGPTAKFRIGVHSPYVAGTPASFPLQATDLFGNFTPTYNGTATITSSDGAATLPAPVTFVNGVSSAPVTFNTAGPTTLTVTDTIKSSTTSTASFTVNAPGPAVSIKIIAPASVTAGVPFGFDVVALDGNGNKATAYPGTVHFTSNSAGTLPADAPLTAGFGHFTATLTTTGRHSLIGTDTVSPSVTGGTNVQVN